LFYKLTKWQPKYAIDEKPDDDFFDYVGENDDEHAEFFVNYAARFEQSQRDDENADGEYSDVRARILVSVVGHIAHVRENDRYDQHDGQYVVNVPQITQINAKKALFSACFLLRVQIFPLLLVQRMAIASVLS
jgi:hypothetical protein